MLNESAMKAGLPTNSTTLLNYINGSSTSSNTLLSALSSKTSKTDATQKNTYQQLETSGNALESSAAVFTSEQEDNIFAKAREQEDTAEIKKQAKELISNYNDIVKKLTNSDSTVNTYYKKMLQEAYSENKESLSGIGISTDKNGYLSLDETKFDAADIDTLEEALGASSSFSVKTGYIAGRVVNNAESYLESLSSQYSASGTNYSSYTASKYDFWG
jgi:hypothetical protein